MQTRGCGVRDDAGHLVGGVARLHAAAAGGSPCFTFCLLVAFVPTLTTPFGVVAFDVVLPLGG